MNDPLKNFLPVRDGELVKDLGNNALLCVACGHSCKLRPGQCGVCIVRWNDNGVLQVPFGYTAGLHNDPIEKKPFFHALPGSRALSFGMLGCDFKCAYCQNWFSSQTFRDPASTTEHSPATPKSLCDLAQSAGAKTIVSTYNEPLITAEWSVAVFKEAKSRNLKTAFVSNGHGTPEVLDYLKPWIDFYKVDLKSFSEKNYRRLGGNLPAVLDTIQHLHSAGIWLEIVTLVIPGYNDSDAELREIAEFIAHLSKDIPWHITAFHPDYKMRDRGRTAPATLLRAWETGRKAGLNYVYSGNLPGQVENTENTHCPDCGMVLIERYGFKVIVNRISGSACPQCNCAIPGRWN
jgi:pyruvate formate lyase activating enzyme